jgi:hypothetical protein
MDEVKEDAKEVEKKVKKSSRVILPVVAGILILAGIAATYYFYTQNQKSQALLKDPTAAQTAEVKVVTAEIGKLMDLPTGEDPTVATVLDKTKLAGQAFFVKAENGDKVLIYSKAGEAILYRPSTNRIINVSPVNANNTPSTTSTTTNIKVAVYNGTGVVGLTTKFAADIVKLVTNLTITQKSNAAKSDYQKSLVIDLNGKNTDTAQQMASLIGGDVSALPAGEAKPTDATTDLLVILGKDYTAPATAPSSSPSASPTP